MVTAWCNDALPELDFSRNFHDPSHTHLDRTWTAPALSHSPFPFPGDGSLILPLKSIMGFGECGTLDPMKSHPTECCQEASIHLQPQGCHGQSCWLQCQQPLSAPRVAGGDVWSASSSFCQALEQLRYGHWTQQHSYIPSKPPARNPKELSSVSDGTNLLPHHLSFPGPSSCYACTGGLFFLQREEQNFLCSKAALQLQRNSSHFRYQEN